MNLRRLVFALALVVTPIVQTAEAEPIALERQGNWQIYGDSPHYLELSLGAFDADEERSAAARIEFRFGRKYFFIGPAIGLLASTDGAYFGYGGLYADIAYKRLIITPFGGIGAFEQGDARDLGGVFQFRAALTLSYQFENLSRLGVQIGHISNGGTHTSNSSEQDAFLTFAIPF